MLLADYQELIQNLPVRQQSFKARFSTWRNIADKVMVFRPYFRQLFYEQKEAIQISRQDIFDTKDIKTKVLKIIIWGYPRGMRGTHFETIMEEFIALVELMEKYQGQNLSSEEYQKVVLPYFKKVPGLGLSTYSKLLYFFELKIDDHPCLILDERLLRTFRAGQFEAFLPLSTKPRYKPETWYVDYLRLMEQQAIQLGTKPENLEQFLFLFGGYLKS